jgi:hypothetical protein
MSVKAPNSRVETELNVKFTILSPHGEVIGIFRGTWNKAITEKAETRSSQKQTLVKDTFNGEIDQHSQATFLSSLSERRIFRNLLLLIETEKGERHRCACNLTVENGMVKGTAVSPVKAD